MAMFTKGIVLTQYKEPAFSRPIVRFVNPHSEKTLNRNPISDVNAIRPDEIIEIAKEAQIVDERDGKLLYRKLLRAKGQAVAVIADAVDDEPYVSSQINPMLKLREEAAGGLRFCALVAGCNNTYIVAYKNITDTETRIPRKIESIKVVNLYGGYPAEKRMQQLKLEKGRRLIVGVGALIHLYRAVTQNKKQSTVFITVAGNCVANPMNLEVSLGFTVMQVLERCGLVKEPTRVVCGGPMTGIAILDAERTFITYTTRAVLAFSESMKDRLYNCIGCGRCEQVCPAGLNPMYIHRFVENSYFAHLKPFDAHLCTGCGTCSYICPSKLNVAGTVAKAKRYAEEHFITVDEEADELES